MPALKQNLSDLLFCNESSDLGKWQNTSCSWSSSVTAPSLNAELYIDLLEQFNIKKWL